AGVARRKRAGYWFLLIYFGLQFCADALLVPLLILLPPDTWEPRPPPGWAVWVTAANLVITAGVLIVLYLARREFYAKVQRGSLPKALGVLGGLLVWFVILGWALVEAFPGTLRGSGDRLTYAIEKILGGAFTFDFTRRGHAAGWVNLLLGLFGGIALFVALY